jgi:hypothetical protein
MSTLDDPGMWRKRAAETRRLATLEPDPNMKQELERIASSYDKLAERAAQRQNSN